ncbi:Alpha-N-acetylgalactosaminidase [Anaerohalosphaera lusitana]|uniref:Alpha-N-acetylgalactosaminidase n=1 Tax=Anaerohalosphaera lusitana TaxID=1936003 RepID=A0A1U9NN87_9BACT|nr:Gfo/Idh/MocA family oxidoreductase [Anaerohalosphaera lusitana]AQT69080.1 Alpha-N-acetylgalactosaminidase [Anaerohalosphaera lusitana]
MGFTSRRDFLKSTGLLTAGMALTGRAKIFGASASDKVVKIGMVGTGARGTSLLATLTGVKNIEIKALCDINKNALSAATRLVEQRLDQKPDEYSGDEHAYKKLMARDDLDAVIIATPWEWHTPMAVYCMNAGKYAGVEVPSSLTIDECWELVNTSEETGVPCMMLENWSFRRDNLAVLNMIRQGLFGQIVHSHCAHSHDCIDHWFFDAATGKDRWPAKYLLDYNRDQYPTHSVGPVYSWMDIGCGDYLDSLTSTATLSAGINDYFKHKFGPDHPGAKREYAQGDIVTTTIKTKKGKTIIVNYDMQLPRPYDNRWMIQGTRGLYDECHKSVYLADHSPGYHQWEPFAPYQNAFEHKWWQQEFQGGHGGTDFLTLKTFIDAVRDQTQTPLDVYDAVLMSCLVPLSGKSIKEDSKPVKVPDFTRGKWKTREPYFAIDNRKFKLPGSAEAQVITENGMPTQAFNLGKGKLEVKLPDVSVSLVGNPSQFSGWPGIGGTPTHCLYGNDWGIDISVPRNSSGVISVYAYDFEGQRKQSVTFEDRKADKLESFSKGTWLEYPFTKADSKDGKLRLRLKNLGTGNSVLSKLKISISNDA